MINVKVKSYGSAILTFTFIALSLWTLSSCQREKILFTDLAEIGGNGWMYQDSIRFVFSTQDTSTVYNLNLEVTHAEDYAWQNAYVMIKTGFPGDSIKTDILSLEFSDGSGAWAGICKSGKCHLTIPLQQNLRFPVQGDYSLTFIQHMRQEIVPGIFGFRLTVVEAEGRKGGKAER